MRTLLFTSVLAMAGIMGACKGGGEAKEPSYEAKRDSMLERSRNPKTEHMRDYNYTTNIECSWADAYAISRNASDSLGIVTDDEGTRYVNNFVQLALTQGGATVFRHVFTKNDFAPMGDSRFFRRAVLQGMAFDGVQGNDVRFVASVGKPDSDEFVQFAITVSQDGNYTIVPTEIMDETLVDEEETI